MKSPHLDRSQRLFQKTGAISLCLPLALAFFSNASTSNAQETEAMNVPEDVRNGNLVDLNGYFPMQPPSNMEAWKTRSADLKTQLEVFLGLWPLPEKSALNPVIHGRVDMGDYSVEKVYFESFPGFYVTGNLYRPTATYSEPRPAVLCPHGHWANGRFMDEGVPSAKNSIQSGAETTEEGGRNPLQARCVQLARLGAVVFHYDMIGYADSQQIPSTIAHGFAKQRPELISAEKWGMFSPQAESKLQNIMGLQTWNSIRALDFLETLPDVDPSRIGVTGASGGGTQTFILAAIDPRPAVAFPAVMVSTAMQGGCVCENASGVRVGTGNVEIAGLFAPKPLGMTAANDWTVEMETKGFPELKSLYQTFGCPEHVHLSAHTEFGHNYNQVSRQAMYRWMNQWLKLGSEAPDIERPFTRLEKPVLTVWNETHQEPAAGVEFETDLLKRMDQSSLASLKQLWSSREAIKNVYHKALETILYRDKASIGQTDWVLTKKISSSSVIEMEGSIVNRTHGEVCQALFLYPTDWNGKTAIWASPNGAQGLKSQEKWLPEVERLLSAGWTVVGVDLFGIEDGKAWTESRKVNNPREFAGYTLGYNQPLFAQRVHDLLSVLQLTRTYSKSQSKEVAMIGVAGAGHWVAAAGAIAGDMVDYVMIETDGFRFDHLDSINHPDLLPGASKYGDLPGMIAMNAPHATVVLGETCPNPMVSQFFETFSASDQIRWINESDSASRLDQGLDWIMEVSK